MKYRALVDIQVKDQTIEAGQVFYSQVVGLSEQEAEALVSAGSLFVGGSTHVAVANGGDTLLVVHDSGSSSAGNFQA